MWYVFSHINKLIVAQIADKFPVLMWHLKVYCRKPSLLTLPTVFLHLTTIHQWQTFRRFICVVLGGCSFSSLAVLSPSLDFSSSWTAWPRRLASSTTQLWRHMSHNTTALCISDDCYLGVPCSHLMLETLYAKYSSYQRFHSIPEDRFLYSTSNTMVASFLVPPNSFTL
jgi:hypothetical protein